MSLLSDALRLGSINVLCAPQREKGQTNIHLNTQIGFRPLKRLTLKTDCNVFLQNFDIYSQIFTFSRLFKPFFIEDILTCCALQTSWLWVGFFKEIYSAFWRGFHWMWGKIKPLLLGVYVSLFL